MTTERIAGHVTAVCISEETGMRKKNVGEAFLVEGFGIEKDAHADGGTHRQVSLLAQESIKKMQAMGLDVHAGDFAENITTQGVDLLTLAIGTRIRLGEHAVLEITQHGKQCHAPCAIYHQAGTCVMPTEGIFARVLESGSVRVGDNVTVIEG